jgi:pilus assembly protein Flp/PilA
MFDVIQKVKRLWERGLTREEGQGLVEYALILVLVSVVAIGALKALGGSITGILNNVANTLNPV